MAAIVSPSADGKLTAVTDWARAVCQLIADAIRIPQASGARIPIVVDRTPTAAGPGAPCREVP